MLDRIDTFSTNRTWARPAISIETKMGDVFDNTSRRPSRVDVRRLNPKPEAAPRFSNLLSLLPYLDHSYVPPAGIGSHTLGQQSVLESAEVDDGSALTAEDWLKRDLAHMLEVTHYATNTEHMEPVDLEVDHTFA